MRKTLLAATLAALTVTTAGCNTVKGLGRDIESVGQKGEEVISQAPVQDQQGSQPLKNAQDAQDAQAAR